MELKYTSLKNQIIGNGTYGSQIINGELVKIIINAKTNASIKIWNAVDAPGSTLEYDVSRSYTVGTGEPIFGFDLAKVASDKLFVNSLSIELRPQDTLSIIADSQSVTDIKATIVMNEEF